MTRQTTSISLREPAAADQDAFLTAALRSRTLHRPWTTAPTTADAFRAYLDRMAQPSNHGFLVCSRRSDEIVGVINLTNVVMGPFRSGYLGYYVFAGHERQGFMHAGLRATARLAFTSLGLHRLEANIQPTNTASIALVASCGFTKEGYSPRYLKIGGRWRDHERWALIAK